MLGFIWVLSEKASRQCVSSDLLWSTADMRNVLFKTGPLRDLTNLLHYCHHNYPAATLFSWFNSMQITSALWSSGFKQ